MDQLSQVIDRFALQAGVFYSGKLCGLSSFNHGSLIEGHLHLLRRGSLSVIGLEKEKIRLDKATIIFVPRPLKHSLLADESDDAELICASIKYGTGSSNLLANALPDVLILPVEQLPFLQTNVDWLLDEADKQLQGRQAIMNRLMEVFIINMLRSLIDNGKLGSSMLAGLVHPQLKNVLHHIHNAPEQAWSLEKMAEIALMSRSKFAEVFKEVIGQTPNDYLLEWRVSVAQSLLLKGKSVSLVANSVGYETASALSRVFRKKLELSPKEWLELQAQD